MLFEHLCEHAFGRFRHVMRILKNELFRAIFIDYDAHATLAAAVDKRDPRAFCYLPPGTELPSFDQVRGQIHKIANIWNLLSFLTDRLTKLIWVDSQRYV
jgi:hypothetical protein